MEERIFPLSMIKKTYHQVYHFTCSFEEIVLNLTHQMWVTFTLSKAG